MKKILALFITLFLVSCGGSGGSSTASQTVTEVNTGTVQVDERNGRFKLIQSSSDISVWTDFPSERILKTESIPEATGSQIELYSAKNEFEPIQIILTPKESRNVNITAPDFGNGITVEIHQVKYIYLSQATDNLGAAGYYPDPLYPIDNGSQVTLTGNENNPFWFTINVPKTISSGDYTANIKIGTLEIPVKLHVFNFAISDELHVKSQMNFSYQTFLTKYGVSGTGTEYWKYVDGIKQFFIDHRLTSKSSLWPGGVTSTGGAPFINYNSATGTFTDSDGIWGFENPADKYLNGNGFNGGVGFPSFMAMTFRNNDSSLDQRPDIFDGITKSSSDWYISANPNTAYNQKWFKYMTDLQNYLNGLNYLDKAYYYFANEPQNQEDYDAVAWYSKELKKSAPNLKLMISEEPKSEIYNHANYTGGQIDIWLPVLNNYNKDESWVRERDYGEESWVYFLHGTRPPYFNPITLDHPGIESKLTGWLLWKYRIKGIAYYSMNDWSKNPWLEPMTAGHNGDLFMLYPPSENNGNISYGATNHKYVTSIRFELMRDSLEDFEYLYALNGNNMPKVYQTNVADNEADKIISGLTSYNRDSNYMYTLRKYIGLKIGGEIASIPDVANTNLHIRAQGTPGNYYINFQDPNANPTENPLTIDSREYMKIGWNVYDSNLGYGWYGDMAHVKYQYLSSVSDKRQASIIYDDWGREKTFEFDLPNGTYNVTVSCGWSGKSYSHNKINIEGIDFINDEATNSYIVRTKSVTINDNKLTMTMGIFDEYTMLNYMMIESK